MALPGIVFALAFAICWWGQYVTQEGQMWANEFWNATLENWQSEFLQLLWQWVFFYPLYRVLLQDVLKGE